MIFQSPKTDFIADRSKCMYWMCTNVKINCYFHKKHFPLLKLIPYYLPNIPSLSPTLWIHFLLEQWARQTSNLIQPSSAIPYPCYSEVSVWQRALSIHMPWASLLFSSTLPFSSSQCCIFVVALVHSWRGLLPKWLYL